MLKTSAAGLPQGSYPQVTDQVAQAAKKFANQVSTAGVIDGVVKNRAPKVLTHNKIVHRTTTPQAQAVHSKAHRSYTLMRKAVSRPAPYIRNSNKILPTGTFHNQQREDRASGVAKNTKIKKFSFASAPKKVTEVKPEVKPTEANSKIIKKQAIVAGETHPVVMPSMVTSVSSQRLEAMLDQALLKAHAHKQARKSKRGFWSRRSNKGRFTSITAVALIVVLLGTFFAWQNVPQISMRMAATRAKIPASIPSYTPSGFSFVGPINYQGGQISLVFKANADSSRRFVLIQQKSNWDSDTLVANVIPKSAPVQTSQVSGNKIFIYGQTNDATWVNKGVRYTLKDQASLNSEQIIKLADSL